MPENGGAPISLSDRHLGLSLSVEELPFVEDLRLTMRVDAIWVSQESLVSFAKDVIERYGS